MGQWQDVYDFPGGVYDTSQIYIGQQESVYDLPEGVGVVTLQKGYTGQQWEAGGYVTYMEGFMALQKR